MKIAVILVGNPNNRKGLFNVANERTKNLIRETIVDAYLIQLYDDFFFKLFRKKSDIKKEAYTIIDGVKYKNIWIKHRLIDYILTYKFKLKAISFEKQLYSYIDYFKQYELILPHTIQGIYLAYLVNEKYNIPFIPTWHGSDIHTSPFRNKKVFNYTQKLIKNATFNFFVSKKLLEVSESIYSGNNKGVLYSGPSNIFTRFPEKRKKELLTKFDIKTKYVAGFIGNLEPVKNVLVLPEIFAQVQNSLDDTTFVIVGDGKLETDLKNKIHAHKIKNVIFLGKQEPEDIPDIMNCLNVLVLPSLNEGMPRVTLEALACGVNVVGSDVGGISESIGNENTFPHGNNFVENISVRIIEILKNEENPQPLSEVFSWKNTIKKEVNVYKAISKKSNHEAY